MLASLALLTGCEKDDDPTSVSLRSITREKFDYKGGLASAIVDAGGRDVTAERIVVSYCSHRLDRQFQRSCVYGLRGAFSHGHREGGRTQAVADQRCSG